MMQGSRAIAIWVTAVACALIFIATTVIAAPLPPLPLDPFWLTFLGLPLVGGFILTKRPGNAVGAVLLAIGASAALSAGTNLAAYTGLPRPDLWVLVNQLAFVPVFVLVPLLLIIFPGGELPSRRWRPALIGAWLLAALLVVWLSIRPVEYSFDNIEFYPNPIGIPGLELWDQLVLGIAQAGLIIFGGAAVVQAARSYGTASRQERLQVKWVLLPAAIGPLVFVIGIMLENIVGRDAGNLIVMVGMVGGGNGLAAGVGAAILRHNLFEIDRIISRTVTYALVIGLLGLVVLFSVGLLAVFLPSDDPLVVAVSTLVVFALFDPVRRRVQGQVDRRFHRSRYDASRVIDDFTGTLQYRVDPDGVVHDWVGVVEETMQPVSVGVWVREA